MQVFVSGHVIQNWKANSRIAARPPDNQAGDPPGRCRALAVSLGEDRRITVPPPT
jgi:hypothetical protein